jgi:hypothetical protein
MTSTNTHGLTTTAPGQPAPASVVVVRRGTPPRRRQPLAVSRQAQRFAAVILEVLAGVRTPADAAAWLAVSVPRYYLWEQRALEGLVAACEPRFIGRTVSLQHQIADLQKEVVRLKQENLRQQALVRAAERTIGLTPLPAPKPATKAGGTAAGKRTRKRRPAVRALKAVAALRAASAPEDGGAASGAPPPDVLQQSTVSNPSPPTAPACTDTIGG